MGGLLAAWSGIYLGQFACRGGDRGCFWRDCQGIVQIGGKKGKYAVGGVKYLDWKRTA